MSAEVFSIDIKGMSCEHCAAAVERLISTVDGVQEVSVSLEAGKAAVAAVAGQTNRNQLIAQINNSEIYKAS